MSSKRKSPPTKLDGGGISNTPTSVSNGTDLSLHHNNSPSNPYLDLTTIKSESESQTLLHTNHNHHHIMADGGDSLNYLNHQMNGDRLKSKRRSDPNQFHMNEQSHSLQNLLSKRRKSENFDNVSNHHESVMNFVLRRGEIKREQNGSDNDEYNNNNNNNEIELKKELMVSSKKTMNDVLKVLTNKMKGSTIKDSRKRLLDGGGGGGGEEEDEKRFVLKILSKLTILELKFSFIVILIH